MNYLLFLAFNSDVMSFVTLFYADTEFEMLLPSTAGEISAVSVLLLRTHTGERYDWSAKGPYSGIAPFVSWCNEGESVFSVAFMNGLVGNFLSVTRHRSTS